MTRLAVVGAGGFVGARLVEMAALGGGQVDGCEIVPVIRQYRALGRMARLGIRGVRMADAAKPDTLVAAFRGCDAVVNVTMGDNWRILPDVRNLYDACARAGVPRFIHLSSAAVFGRCDNPGLTDDSDWQRDQWMGYARAKGHAEDWLRGRPSPAPLVVTLRPGLVWGPNASWTIGPAAAIADGSAFLVDDGRWACNTCFVDNLVHDITAVARFEQPVAGFFNVGDPDRPTWGQYYEALAQAMGIRRPAFHSLRESDFRESWGERLAVLKNVALVQALKRRLRTATRARLKYELIRLRQLVWRPPAYYAPAPAPTRLMVWLQTTRYQLPIQKFDSAYPGRPQLPFAEAMSRTAAWLRFAGYAVGDATTAS